MKSVHIICVSALQKRIFGARRRWDEEMRALLTSRFSHYGTFFQRKKCSTRCNSGRHSKHSFVLWTHNLSCCASNTAPTSILPIYPPCVILPLLLLLPSPPALLPPEQILTFVVVDRPPRVRQQVPRAARVVIAPLAALAPSHVQTF